MNYITIYPLAPEKLAVSNNMLSVYCNKIADEYDIKVGNVKNTNDFDKDFFKLMMNSIYGKTIENLRKRINVRLVNNAKDFLKNTSRPTYVTHKLFDKDYAAIHEIKSVLVLNKPIYVAFTVLDLSKWNMYDSHYNFIKFDAELLFTDTDSLAYEIKSENVYEEFYKWKDLFDFSNYSKDSIFYDDTNKKVIGIMKDEYDGVIGLPKE